VTSQTTSGINSQEGFKRLPAFSKNGKKLNTQKKTEVRKEKRGKNNMEKGRGR